MPAMDDHAHPDAPLRGAWASRAISSLSPRYWALVAIEVGFVLLLLGDRGSAFTTAPSYHDPLSSPLFRYWLSS